jgi:hypothetical protein
VETRLTFLFVASIAIVVVGGEWKTTTATVRRRGLSVARVGGMYHRGPARVGGSQAHVQIQVRIALCPLPRRRTPERRGHRTRLVSLSLLIDMTSFTPSLVHSVRGVTIIGQLAC